MGHKILLLIQHLANGGAERVVPLWAQILTDAGHDVTVLTFYPRPDEYPLDPRVKRVNLVATFEEYAQFTNESATSKKLFETYLHKHPQDLVLPFLFSNNLLTAFCDQTNVRILTQTIRNNPWDEKQEFDLAVRDWAIQKQGSVILQNTEQVEYFDTEKFKHVKKYVIHNPLHPAITGIEKTNYQAIKKIVAVGRLAPQKNHALMIEAIRILRDEFHENYDLDIYGIGELQETLQTQIDQAKLGDQVKLCGRNDDIFHLLPNYDLFIMTSLFEGTPNALLEAMGIGLPSLAIKCRTGITELIDDGKNGYLLDGYNAYDLAIKIRAINDPVQLAQIGKQARIDMTRYAPEKIQPELVAVVQDLLQNPPQITDLPIMDALECCQLQKPTDYQNYFESSLRTIKIADYAIGKQIFKHARRTLQNAEIKINITSTTKKFYYVCLRFNQFDLFYEFLQEKHRER